MNRSMLAVLGGVVVIGVLSVVVIGFKKGDALLPKEPTLLPPVATEGSDPKNISYRVKGAEISLTNGMFEREAAPGSASKEMFMIFGEPLRADLDQDGDDDAIMYLTQSGGGSGTFFYVVAALNDAGVYKGTDAMFLGDRIAPQNIVFQEGRAVANFAERKAGEPFTTEPSVGKSVWIHLDTANLTLGEFVKDFEGDTDPKVMTLGMKTWNWIRTDYANGTSLSPKQANVFGLTFTNDGSFSAKTDCNTAGGAYTTEKNGGLTFGQMMSTLMFCEGSQESEFTTDLAKVSAYHFTSRGEMILDLKESGGTMTFR